MFKNNNNNKNHDDHEDQKCEVCQNKHLIKYAHNGCCSQECARTLFLSTYIRASIIEHMHHTSTNITTNLKTLNNTIVDALAINDPETDEVIQSEDILDEEQNNTDNTNQAESTLKSDNNSEHTSTKHDSTTDDNTENAHRHTTHSTT